MAEGIVFNIASSILNLLSPQVRQTIGELWVVKDELEKLQRTVSTINAVLDHAEEQYDQNPQVKDWVAQLKDALYDAEDLLGKFYVECQLKDLRSQKKIVKEVSTFFSSSNQLALRLKMARKLKQVIMKIDAVSDSRKFHLDEHPGDRKKKMTTRREENEHSFIPMEEIIGRDDDRREIVRRLLHDPGREENVTMVSIVGIGGLGKTALAKSVFHEEDVEKHFQLRMWVTVSDEFDLKMLVGKILASAKDADHPEHFGMDQMQRRLRQEIDGKRYLLVLDDLWNENREEWLNLKNLLGGGAKGSKVLITTRAEIVSVISGVVEPYVLKGLTPAESLDLLMRCASSERQSISKSEKASIGKEVVEKCCGVPLAIRVIGGMLFLKETEAEWLFFKDNELQKIPRRENDITAVLRISYDHLPSNLKQCFAFCSLFPKDYDIRKSTLTSLWIAEGFIQPSLGGGLHLEQEAHDSFMYLFRRSFFQDRVDDALGNMESCKMHDLMHDLACQVAGTECRLIGSNNEGTSQSNTIRHLSCPSNDVLENEFPKLQLENTKLRTLLSVDKWQPRNRMLSLRFCREVISSMKYLRALTLCNRDMKLLPSCLCKLKLLSYLDLSYNENLERLPNSIGNLQNLTTLILPCCGSLRELPRDIVKLVRLINLYLDDCNNLIRMPRGFGKLTSLCRLNYFVVGEDSSKTKNCAAINELSGLNNLRGELKIEMVGYIKDAAIETERADLKAKQFLDRLILGWVMLEDNKQNEAELMENHEKLLEGLQPHANLRVLEITGYKGTRFPRWIMEGLPNLVELDICDCLNLMSLLESTSKLKSLKYLSIQGCDKLTVLPDQIGDLTSLRVFTIENYPNLTSLSESISQLKSLQRLSIVGCDKLTVLPNQIGELTLLRLFAIEDCPNLTSFPESISQLKSLRCLRILRCKQLSKKCMRETDEEWYKIKHIPKIWID